MKSKQRRVANRPRDQSLDSAAALVRHNDLGANTSIEHVVSAGAQRPANTDPGDEREMSQPLLTGRLGERLGTAAAFATTEHFNLQSARAITVSESHGRAGIYLAAVSSNLVALAFIGQLTRVGAAFYAFALILLPVLAFAGVVTFVRLVQTSLEDLAYAHRIALLRSFYLEVVPELEPFLVTLHSTGCGSQTGVERLAPSAWQLTLTVAGMIAVINSVVIAACAGLAIGAVGWIPIPSRVAVGALVACGAFLLHERHHRLASAGFSPDVVDQAAIRIRSRQRSGSA